MNNFKLIIISLTYLAIIVIADNHPQNSYGPESNHNAPRMSGNNPPLPPPPQGTQNPTLNSSYNGSYNPTPNNPQNYNTSNTQNNTNNTQNTTVYLDQLMPCSSHITRYCNENLNFMGPGVCYSDADCRLGRVCSRLGSCTDPPDQHDHFPFYLIIIIAILVIVIIVLAIILIVKYRRRKLIGSRPITANTYQNQPSVNIPFTVLQHQPSEKYEFGVPLNANNQQPQSDQIYNAYTFEPGNLPQAPQGITTAPLREIIVPHNRAQLQQIQIRPASNQQYMRNEINYPNLPIPQ